MTLNEIIPLIELKTNYRAKQYGNGHILRCPSHEDKKPSLSISETNNGKILMYCFCGCNIKDICSSIGIEIKDLFPKSNRGPSYE